MQLEKFDDALDVSVTRNLIKLNKSVKKQSQNQKKNTKFITEVFNIVDSIISSSINIIIKLNFLFRHVF